MRAFPPRGTASEVWNQGICKYVADVQGDPRPRPARRQRSRSSSTPTRARCSTARTTRTASINYEYSLVYGLDGRVDETNPAAADWISVGGEALFAPLNVLEVVESRWQGHNPYVTEANVRSLDMANGGGFDSRLAGKAPDFRPVDQYEAGRAPMFAGTNDASESPRRGFFRTIFGR